MLNKNSNTKSDFFDNTRLMTATGIGLVSVIGFGFGLFRYKTSRSNELLVRTGLGICDI